MADAAPEAVVVGVVGGDAPPGYEPPPGKTLGERVQEMQVELDLPEDIVRDLLTLTGSDVVVIADDSSSMNSIADPSSPTPYATRWDELRNTLTALITMLLVIDHSDGFWLKFLNDETWYAVNSAEELQRIFAGKPQARGLTPLLTNMNHVCQGYGPHAEGDTIVLVLTDGQPSDGNVSDLQTKLQARAKKVFLSFLMCTSEDEVVQLYNRCVDPIWGCDITDDYLSEKKECERKGNSLNQNKWLAKCVLGGKMGRKYDVLDEAKAGGGGNGCCVIS